MKTNRQLNQEHERKELLRVRPKQPEYAYQELEAIVNSWIRTSNQNEPA